MKNDKFLFLGILSGISIPAFAFFDLGKEDQRTSDSTPSTLKISYISGSDGPSDDASNGGSMRSSDDASNGGSMRSSDDASNGGSMRPDSVQIDKATDLVSDSAPSTVDTSPVSDSVSPPLDITQHEGRDVSISTPADTQISAQQPASTLPLSTDNPSPVAASSTLAPSVNPDVVEVKGTVTSIPSDRPLNNIQVNFGINMNHDEKKSS
jgi:hypothetical protein